MVQRSKGELDNISKVNKFIEPLLYLAMRREALDITGLKSITQIMLGKRILYLYPTGIFESFNITKVIQ
jgi:hypothetical protein